MELRLSPRRFDGWEPRERTRYRYDAEGRVAETVTTRDPEWDDTDRAIIMAAVDIRADRHHCGHLMSEVLKLAPDDWPEGYTPPEFDGETRICLACEAEGRYLREWERKDEQSRRDGAEVFPQARIVTMRQRTSGPTSPEGR